jgi:hypothetical protein
MPRGGTLVPSQLQTYSEKNRDLLIYINGDLVHRDEAGVSPFDSSVQNGDAVWEGLGLYQGRIFRLEEHLDRLYRSAEMLRYEGLPARQPSTFRSSYCILRVGHWCLVIMDPVRTKKTR